MHYNQVPVELREQNVQLKSEELKWVKYQNQNTKGHICILFVYCFKLGECR